MDSTIIPQQAGYGWASTDAEMFETSARRMMARGVPMGEKEAEGVDLGRLCQGVSPNDEPCERSNPGFVLGHSGGRDRISSASA
jgi:hypothetical protein